MHTLYRKEVVKRAEEVIELSKAGSDSDLHQALVRLENLIPHVLLNDQYIEERIEKMPWSGCWIWMENISEGGYGMLTVSKHRLGHRSAHRLSYEVFKGPISDGLLVCHSCDTPACVNPDHLFLGTIQDNNKDRHRKGRTRQRNHVVLTEAQVREIEASSGTRKQLSEQYGVHAGTIKAIKTHRSWKHLWL